MTASDGSFLATVESGRGTNATGATGCTVALAADCCGGSGATTPRVTGATGCDTSGDFTTHLLATGDARGAGEPAFAWLGESGDNEGYWETTTHESVHENANTAPRNLDNGSGLRLDGGRLQRHPHVEEDVGRDLQHVFRTHHTDLSDKTPRLDPVSGAQSQTYPVVVHEVPLVERVADEGEVVTRIGAAAGMDDDAVELEQDGRALEQKAAS